MIKNRVFMMGLGIGLVTGGILLQLMMIGQGSVWSGEPEDLTKEQLIAAAEAMELKVIEAEDELMTAEQWEESRSTLAEDVPSESNTNQGAEQPENPNEPVKPNVQGGDAVQPPAATDEPAEPEIPVSKETAISIRIPSGNNLSDIASQLLGAGIIDDKQAFIDQATVRKANTVVRSGSYSFVPGEDYDDIITKITTKPSN
ncbi:hypothetical protein JCM10914A_54540 [Paenibacillus sp. JCM 10914]|uniref:endolytic transglycosylase MltG n=1 Tax=Paenibacillus sp. JCM 10914 TaxID=1236974 RepID=UPI0003CC5C30|nr:endolytic transglycosylase MltG [Paenibacillus sp. JCM 10914]GAE04805.1 hypothetical protein JCM10914_877 [Paenibacillus sp. JCM 10914]